MPDWQSAERRSSAHRMDMHPIVETERKGPMYSRGQLVSMLLASVLLVYAVGTGDVPLFFLLLSLLVYLLRPVAEKLAGAWLSNAMQGFSLALGMGALVMAFW